MPLPCYPVIAPTGTALRVIRRAVRHKAGGGAATHAHHPVHHGVHGAVHGAPAHAAGSGGAGAGHNSVLAVRCTAVPGPLPPGPGFIPAAGSALGPGLGKVASLSKAALVAGGLAAGAAGLIGAAGLVDATRSGSSVAPLFVEQPSTFNPVNPGAPIDQVIRPDGIPSQPGPTPATPISPQAQAPTTPPADTIPGIDVQPVSVPEPATALLLLLGCLGAVLVARIRAIGR